MIIHDRTRLIDGVTFFVKKIPAAAAAGISVMIGPVFSPVSDFKLSDLLFKNDRLIAQV